MASKRHIIVGGGTAGLNAITTIREIDHGASEIVLVSAERPYSRMVLPYYLARDISESHVFTANPSRLARARAYTLFPDPEFPKTRTFIWPDDSDVSHRRISWQTT